MSKQIYIFTGESYMVRESLGGLKKTLNIAYPEINVTEYKTMPKAQEIIEACAVVPFMSEKRLVAVTDCTALTTKGSADEAKKLAAFLPRMPESTALVLCTNEAPDRRRTLYAEVKKLGTVREFASPAREDCIRFVQEQAKKHGAEISSKAAAGLVDASGCDYHILDGEAAKLAAYSGYGTISEAHVKECASKSLEYNVFEIHSLLVSKQASKAKQLLEDITRSERPEGLVGLIARKIRDMYKVKSMTEAGYTTSRAAEVLGFKRFAVEMIAKESKRFSVDDLRGALTDLADLDYGIKSGEKDAATALAETVMKIYKL